MNKVEIIEQLNSIVPKNPKSEWAKYQRSIVNEAIKALQQEPRKGYLSIDDVMSVFDDFMCGEVDENGTETFLEMLKDKAETEK